MMTGLLHRTNPRFNLVLFTSLVLVLAGIGAMVMLLLASWVYGVPMNEFQQWMMQTGDPSVVQALVWMNNISQVVTFLLPPLFLVLLVGTESVGKFMLNHPGKFLLVAPLWLIASGSLIDFASQFNAWIIPENSPLGSYFSEMEKTAEDLTHAMLNIPGSSGVLLGILSIVIIPAFCEEFLFRGTLQPLLARITGRMHLSVWMTAAIFAFIHFQFYGMIPRMILGAMLGYLVVWSGSLWTSVAAHMINNAMAMIVYYRYGDLTTPASSEPGEDVWAHILSLVVFALLTSLLLRWSKWSLIRDRYLGKNSSPAIPLEDPTGT